ncbi:MAG: aspartate dehydrogenase [Alphaproteobacteria bacterium]|nr:aspartate dehydrogenase [Alphaproteobacteria bacterium]
MPAAKAGPPAVAPLRVGMAGFGSVGAFVARRLDEGAIPGVTLTALTARDLDKAARNAAGLKSKPRVVPLVELAELADVVIECATADAFPAIARAVLGAGRTMIALSAAGVPAVPDLLEFALAHRGRLRIASGALPGIDSLRCAAEGTIRSVRLRSRIVPATFIGEPYLSERGFDFTKPTTEAIRVFAGSAREAAAAFPRHFNVAISLSLAGIGFDRTEVEIHADPGVPGAVHQVEVDAEEAQFTLISRNRPSVANPKTSRIIAPSVLAALRTLVAPIHVGS